MLSGILAFVLAEHGWLAGLDTGAYDLGVSTRPAPSGPAQVAVVLIDDASLARLGRWPWPWSRHARFVETLTDHYRPAVIAFDILFAEPDPRDTGHEFARALRRAGNAYLAAYLTQTAEPGGAEAGVPWLPAQYVHAARWEGRHFAALRPPTAELSAAAAGVGPVNVVPELDGSIRRLPLVMEHQGKPYPSLVAVVVNALVNRAHRPVRVEPGVAISLGDYRVPIDGAGEILVSYHTGASSGSPGAIPHVHYDEVLARKAPASLLKGKVVLVGFTAAGMGDVHPTPVAPATYGVDINAHAINGILLRSFVGIAGWPARLGVALLVGLLAALAAGFLSPGRGMMIVLATVAAAVMAIISLLWFRGLWLGVAAPGLAALCGYSLTLAQRYRESERESIRVQASMATLARATGIIGSVRRRSQLLDEIRTQVCEVVGAQQANLYLMDEERECLVLAGERGNSDAHPVSYRLGEGTVGWVAQHRAGHTLGTLQPGSEAERELSRSAFFPVGSVAYAPLEARGELVGVVEVLRGKGESPFTDEHLAALSAVANEVAVALENAKLYEQLTGRVEIANRQLVTAYSELKQERDRVAAIVSNMADGVLLTDPQARIVFINPAAARMFGVEAEQVAGKPVEEALPHPALLSQLADEPPESEVSVPMIRVAGASGRTLVLSPRTVHLLGEGETRMGAITVVSDVTLLQELSEMKTEFVSLVSHELRTPLTSIMGFSQTLREWGDRPASERDEFLGIIEQESYRLLVMINDLLDVSRMEAGRKLSMSYSLVDLREVAEHVVRFQQVVSSRHRFRLEFADAGLQVQADRDKVVQILTNLISNAIKYSPQGGEVVVSGAAEGEEVVVQVSDQGVGMTPEDVSRLFQRYQRVDRDAIKGIRGTGLGLYLVRGLVEAHGGRVWAESTPGKGSTFHFSLPRQARAQAGV